MRLQGKRAVVTGSSMGIGRAIALLLAREGARVVVNARGSGAIDAVVDEIRAAGGEAIGVAGPVDDPDFADALVARCVADFGGIDILINNAAILDEESLGPLGACSTDTWRRTMAVNLDGPFHTCRAALPHMIAQRWGRIVNAGSFAGTGRMGGAAYSASKSALFGMSRAMAADYGPYGITVNVYNPEARTDMGDMVNEEHRAAVFARWVTRGYRTREEAAYYADLGYPEGVAPWVAYLCTDPAARFNGRVFAVERRRVAMLGEPDEARLLFQDAAADGPWTLDMLDRLAPLAFPVANAWPRREGAALEAWEQA